MQAKPQAALVPISLCGVGAIVYVFSRIDALGIYVWSADLHADYLIGVMWAAALSLSILFWPKADRPHLATVWFVRVSVVLIIMPFYEANYPALDAYSYHGYSMTGDMIPGYEDQLLGTPLIFRLCGILNYVGFDSYRALVIFFSYFGLLGSWLAYRGVAEYRKQAGPALFYWFALFPSVLFWSSTLGKDPLCILFLGAATYSVSRWFATTQKRHLAWFVLWAFAVAVIRPWWAVILAVSLLVALRFGKSGKMRLFALPAIVLLLTVGAVITSNHFQLSDLDSTVAFVDTHTRAASSGGSAQQVPEFGGVTDILLFLPQGVITVLFRPFPWEAHNAFALFASLENSFLLLLIIIYLRSIRYKLRTDEISQWSLVIIAAWLIIYALFGYQNLGTAVRYRAPVIPFILMLIGVGAPKVTVQPRRELQPQRVV